MKKIKIYKVDAFTNKLFSGNPAAVCPLDAWLPDAVMQSIALENNLSETAFFIKDKDKFFLRWFTPKVEIDLCGHATLATAHIIYSEMDYKSDNIEFFSCVLNTSKTSGKKHRRHIDVFYRMYDVVDDRYRIFLSSM